MTTVPTLTERLDLRAHTPTPVEFVNALPRIQTLAAKRGIKGDADVLLFISASQDARQFFCVGVVGRDALIGAELNEFLRAYDDDCGDPRDSSCRGIRSAATHILAQGAERDYCAIVGRSAVYEGWRSFRVKQDGTLPTLVELYVANGRDTRGQIRSYYRRVCPN